MGSGKSAVGPLAAQQLGWEFLDLDSLIERRQEQSIAEIFAREGEAAFRGYESAALAEMLGRNSGPCVIALGGGAFSQAENRQAIRRSPAQVAWLDAPVEELLRRCRAQSAGTVRPLLRAESEFRRLYQLRRSDYATAHRIETADLSPAQVAESIVQWLQATLAERA